MIPLPNTMLFTGIKYVSFITLPTYVGQCNMTDDGTVESPVRRILRSLSLFCAGLIAGGQWAAVLRCVCTLVTSCCSTFRLRCICIGICVRFFHTEREPQLHPVPLHACSLFASPSIRAARHDIQWLQASHVEDSLTKVYNPHLPPAPVHAHGVSEEDCRLPGGCGYRMRAGMQSLILTNTAFELPVPSVSELEATLARRRAAATQPRGAHATAVRARRESALNARATSELYGETEPSAENEEAEAEAEAELVRLAETEEEAATLAALGGGAGGSSFSFAQRFRQDESMLIYATNLTIIVDYAMVIESNELAERSLAHTPAEHEVYDFTDGAGRRRKAPATFISPDVLLSFHQYELSPMQHVGVSYIIRGTALLLTAAAVAFVKWSNDSERGKHKHS